MASKSYATHPPSLRKSQFASFPPLPIGKFAIAQCASYTPDQYTSILAREQGLTEAEIEAAHGVYRGVRAFLDLAKGERIKMANSRAQPGAVNLGCEPPTHEPKTIIPFPGWGISIRIFGYNMLQGTDSFAFDFLDAQSRHTKAPPNLKISTINYRRGTAIHSIQESMAASFKGMIADNIRNATEEEFGQEVYLVLQGTKLRVSYMGSAWVVQIPFHQRHSLAVATLSPF